MRLGFIHLCKKKKKKAKLITRFVSDFYQVRVEFKKDFLFCGTSINLLYNSITCTYRLCFNLSLSPHVCHKSFNHRELLTTEGQKQRPRKQFNVVIMTADIVYIQPPIQRILSQRLQITRSTITTLTINHLTFDDLCWCTGLPLRGNALCFSKLLTQSCLIGKTCAAHFPDYITRRLL